LPKFDNPTPEFVIIDSDSPLETKDNPNYFNQRSSVKSAARMIFNCGDFGPALREQFWQSRHVGFILFSLSLNLSLTVRSYYWSENPIID
jgi:hypothetical protein